MLAENVEASHSSSPEFKAPPANTPTKQGHRRRTSALRLSSDISGPTSTLPEYSRTTAALSPTRFLQPAWETQIPEDSPPDYPGIQRSSDSAEEADEETELTGSDSEEEGSQRRRLQRSVPHCSEGRSSQTSTSRFRSRTPLTASPRRPKRFLHQQQEALVDIALGKGHKRRHSSVSLLRTPPRGFHKQTSSLSTTPANIRLASKAAQHTRDTDSFLDSLLERSVYALEMSNTLLQSSMSTQATMSALFSGSSTSLGAFRSATTPPPPPPSQVKHDGPIDSKDDITSYHGYHDVDSALEARAIGLSSKLMRNWDVQENWVQELENIKRSVDSLFDGEDEQHRRSASHQSHIRQTSHSFPNTSPLSTLRRSSSSTGHRERLSIELFRDEDGSEGTPSHRLPQAIYMEAEEGPHSGIIDVLPHQADLSSSSPAHAQLRLAPQGRSNLISPPPRALTMHIDATPTPTIRQPQEPPHEDSSPFFLPSTLGVRASASTNSLLLPSTTSSTVAPPQVTEIIHEPSTPAYNMLSSLAARTGASASTNNLLSSTTSLKVPQRRGSGDAVTTSAPSSFVSSFINRAAAGIIKRTSSPSVNSAPRRASSVDRPTSTSPAAVKSPQPVIPLYHPPLIRRMTPPTEEENESSSSSDGVVAKKTMESLRKILDVQPSLSTVENATKAGNLAPPPRYNRATSLPRTRAGSENSRSSSRSRPSSGFIAHKKPPMFMPRTPAPIPSAGTSHATASISKLFTKGVHTSSARPRSPPLRSNIKGKAPPRLNTDSATSGSSTPNTNQQLLAAAASLNGTGPNSTVISPSPSFSHFPEFVTRALANGNKSASSSGYSTPKRISFAELPESYASTKPEGEPSGMPVKRGKRKSLRRNNSGVQSSGLNVRRPKSPDVGSDGEGRSWWSSWLAPGRSLMEERESVRERMYQEDRATRAWGGRMGMALGAGPGMMDEWGV